MRRLRNTRGDLETFSLPLLCHVERRFRKLRSEASERAVHAVPAREVPFRTAWSMSRHCLRSSRFRHAFNAPPRLPLRCHGYTVMRRQKRAQKHAEPTHAPFRSRHRVWRRGCGEEASGTQAPSCAHVTKGFAGDEDATLRLRSLLFPSRCFSRNFRTLAISNLSS